jgi:large repetitive protein
MTRRHLLFLSAAVALAPAAAWPQGNPLGPEFRVNTYTTGDQYTSGVSGSPGNVASNSAGEFVVVWTSLLQDGGSFGVFGQRYSAGGTPLGPEFQVNTYVTANQGMPSVASDLGAFVVTWMSDAQDGSGYGVFGQRYAPTGAPLGPEFRVNTYTTSQQGYPSVASGPGANFVVVWMSGGQDGSTYGIFGQRYADAGAPLGPEFRVNTYTTNTQGNASVAADGSGNFVVVWASETQDGSGSGVFGQRYASTGAPLGPEFRVNTYTTGYQIRPDVALDLSGNFVIVWASQGQDGSGYGVFGQRYASTGAPLGPEFRVNTFTTQYQDYPSITTDSPGNFVVTWSSDTQDGSGLGVFGQRYDSSGTTLGPEFLVNSYTPAGQSHPSVAADALGNFKVVWTSETQDGSALGVFGQRYNMMVPVELMRFGVE